MHIFLDQEKAYDRAPVPVLLGKLVYKANCQLTDSMFFNRSYNLWQQ